MQKISGLQGVGIAQLRIEAQQLAGPAGVAVPAVCLQVQVAGGVEAAQNHADFIAFTAQLEELRAGTDSTTREIDAVSADPCDVSWMSDRY